MNDQEKLKAFIETEGPQIAGLQLRKFDANALIYLQAVESPLLDQEKMEKGLHDIIFQIAAFLYIMGAPEQEVRRAVLNREGFRDAVLDFTKGMSVAQLSAASRGIQEILKGAVIGMDYQAEDGGPSPN